MKITIFLITLIFTVVFTQGLFAGDWNWELKSDGTSDGVEMKEKYDYDYSNKYRGTVDDDGYVRMRNYDGDTVRGYIDDDGYGKLRGSDGSTWRVKPDY